jgi:hypothetical protein
LAVFLNIMWMTRLQRFKEKELWHEKEMCSHLDTMSFCVAHLYNMQFFSLAAHRVNAT